MVPSPAFTARLRVWGNAFPVYDYFHSVKCTVTGFFFQKPPFSWCF
ncbi:hypothetical protein HanPSC8_Chr04g0170631 [Helianthus annuus]|nr:hypothetical protein HanPSC8_Chr04g0170631 [Helianthus annuus]